MASFEDLATSQLAVTPPEWMQGRALFGGAVSAAMIDAARALAPDREPISMQVTFVGPVSGPCVARARVLREGRGYTHIQAEVLEGDKLRATANLAFAVRRPGTDYRSPARSFPVAPERATWWPYVDGVMPRFTQYFALALAEGAMPMSGAETPSFGGWCRHLTTPGESAEALVGLMDAWPPPAMTLPSGMVPASSVHLSVTFAHLPSGVNESDLFWFDYAAGAVLDGQAHCAGRLFDVEGRLLAQIQQLVAFYG